MARLTPYLRRAVISLPLADRLALLEVLRLSVANPGDNPRARMQHFVEVMDRVAGVEVASPCRDERHTWARNIVCFVGRREGFPQVLVGEAVNRDHSSVSHMERRMKDAFDYPEQYSEAIELYNRFIEAIWKQN